MRAQTLLLLAGCLLPACSLRAGLLLRPSADYPWELIRW